MGRFTTRYAQTNKTPFPFSDAFYKQDEGRQKNNTKHGPPNGGPFHQQI